MTTPLWTDGRIKGALIGNLLIDSEVTPVLDEGAALNMRDEYEAEIARLKAQLATTWQPIEAQTMTERRTINCACANGCQDTAIVYPNDILQVVNKAEQRYADIKLPANVRLCEQVIA